MTTAVNDSKVKQVVSNIRNLPTPPIVFNQIQKVMNSTNVSAGQVAAILSEDPAMSVKVLKLTNSVFYGLSREIESVKQAIVIIGLEAVKNLVLSAAVLGMFKGEQTDQEYQEKFWRHSLAVGFCGRLLAKKIKTHGLIDPDSAFSAGLLHDIGKMVLCCYLPKEFAALKEASESEKQLATYQLEQQVLGYDHCQIGEILTSQWKLPKRLVLAITHHHNPMAVESDDPVVHLIHLANYIAKKTFYDEEEEYLIGEISREELDYMKITLDDMEPFYDELREEYSKAETFMKLAGLD